MSTHGLPFARIRRIVVIVRQRLDRDAVRDAGRAAYGDFQTPSRLAARVAALVARRGLSPASVLEPTCGTGAFVAEALNAFPSLRQLAAFDVNQEYVENTRRLMAGYETASRCEVANVFTRDWMATIAALAQPLLILGNPPWVTASGLGRLGPSNLPRKTNFQRHRGLDARTGKSNFDIAEWLVIRLLEAGQHRDVTLAMLMKTSVARRVLAHVWRTPLSLSSAEILRFDAGADFGVSADGCLLVCRTAGRGAPECTIRTLDQPDLALGCIGWRDGILVADTEAYDRSRFLLADASDAPTLRWRSGIKHDCAAVMELRKKPGGAFVTGDGTAVDLEPDYVYPLLNGTAVAKGRVARTDRWLLITQERPGDDTALMAARAPRSWAYLCRHGGRLDARRSAIYRRRPRFAIFGVGPYTFAPWKVAISALRKRLGFAVVGPIGRRPVVFDDTCYQLSFETERAASFAAELLNSEPAGTLLASMIFWDAKRPITAEVLQRLSLERVARHLGRQHEFDRLIRRGAPPRPET